MGRPGEPTVTDCSICPRTAPDGHHACTACAHQLRAMLTELPQQIPLLQDSLQPGRGPTQGRSAPAGIAHAPLPLDLRVLTLLGPGHPQPPTDDDPDAGGIIPIRPMLYGWAHFIASEHPATARDPYGTTDLWPCDGAHPRHGATIPGWCAWLRAYLPHAITRPWIATLHQQLSDLLALIRDLTHAVPHRHPKPVPCPACGAFALIETDGQWGITCDVCHHYLDPQDYADHAAALLEALQAHPSDIPMDPNACSIA